MVCVCEQYLFLFKKNLYLYATRLIQRSQSNVEKLKKKSFFFFDSSHHNCLALGV